MSQTVSRRQRVGTPVSHMTAGKNPPIAAPPHDESAVHYLRYDTGIGPAQASVPHAESSDQPDLDTAAVSAETLEEFCFRNGQYFDSYLATEPGRMLFWSQGRRGLISYTRRGRYVLVGGGLIAPAEHREELLSEFVEYAGQRKLRLAFHNIGDNDLPVFRKFGFQVSKWGEEPVIDLGSCTWGGKAFEWVRRQTNYCQRKGVLAFEVELSSLTPQQWSRTLSEMLEVSAQCLAQKPQAEEMKFFEGRIDQHALGLRRLFVARSAHGAGRMEGFVVCNPINGGTNWSTEMYRHRSDSVRGTTAFLIHHILRQMQDEGVRQVALCLDPGLRCTKLPGDSFLIRAGLPMAQRFLGCVFDVAGLRHFKSRFRPRYENRYVCTLPRASIGNVWAFIRVFGVFNLNYGKLARIAFDRVRKFASRRNLAEVS